jgi:hypothetical protein
LEFCDCSREHRTAHLHCLDWRILSLSSNSMLHFEFLTPWMGCMLWCTWCSNRSTINQLGLRNALLNHCFNNNMFVNVYYNVVFARAPIGTKVECYFVTKILDYKFLKNFLMMYIENQSMPLLHHDFEQNWRYFLLMLFGLLKSY